MIRIDESLVALDEPRDYRSGIGAHTSLPIPRSILLFCRKTRRKLQQEALQNRSHHRFVLIFNLHTVGTVHVDHLQVPLQPGEALIVLPFQFHHFSHLQSERLKWLFCTFEMAEGMFLEPFRNRVVVPQKGSVQVLNLLLTEWDRCRRNLHQREMQEMQLQIALLYLLISLRDDLQMQAPDLPGEPKQALLRSVNRFMSEWRGRPVAVSDVADALGMSVSSLRSRFRASAGVPLGSYLLNYRLNRAMALLRNSDRSIADIADESGFGSPQAFSRIFRKKVGQTPRAYRHP